MSGKAKLATLIGLAMVAAACGQPDPKIDTAAGTTETVVVATNTDGPEPGYEEGFEQTPIAEWDLTYTCGEGYAPDGGIVPRFGVEELNLAFSTEPGQEQLDRFFQQEDYVAKPGTPADWIALSPDFLLAREPLTSAGNSFLGVYYHPEAPYAEFVPCHLTRTGPQGEVVYSPEWTVAQEGVSGGDKLTIMVSDCAVPDLDTDIRIVDSQLLITVSNWTGCEEAPPHEMSALVLEVPPADGPLTVANGAHWPWLAPVDYVDASPPSPRPLSESPASCSSQAAGPGLSVVWEGIPGATKGQIMIDGEPAEGLSFTTEIYSQRPGEDLAFEYRLMDLMGDDPDSLESPDLGSGTLSTFGDQIGEATRASIVLTQGTETMTIECDQIPPPVLSCSMTLVGGVPALRVADQDGNQGPPIGTFYRDGDEVVLSGFDALDPGAEPGATYNYTARLGIVPGDSAEIDCGSIEVPLTTAGTDDLVQAKQIYDSLLLGPFAYLTFAPVCAECPTDIWDAYGLQDAPGGEVDWQISPKNGQLSPTDLPQAVYPDTVHQVLIDAIEAGSVVEYTLDRSSGVPVEWTIDGVGMRYVCLNFDTAPPDIRMKPGCLDEYDLFKN